MQTVMTRCPGCRLQMPAADRPAHGYYNASPECLGVYDEVLGTEFGNVVLFAAVHQLTVDTYAVQHAGAGHKDKSVCVHLVGLHLALERSFRPPEIAPRLQRLAGAVRDWPHFAPPGDTGPLTVFDVALAPLAEHAAVVRRWARQLWSAWSPHHAAVAELAELAFARAPLHGNH